MGRVKVVVSMIYFYYGTDIDKSRTKSHELIESLRKKKPDASFFKMNTETWSESKLQEYIGSQGLFSNKYIVFLDRLCEKKDVKDEFVGRLKEISESENIFIILEGKLDKATSGKIEKKAEKTVLADLSEKPAKAEYGAFALADAFGRRDKKSAWMLYRKAIDAGEAPEALHGMIFWKVKTMLLSGYTGEWKKEELLEVMEKLVDVYHESRRGKHELETGVEALILGMG